MVHNRHFLRKGTFSATLNLQTLVKSVDNNLLAINILRLKITCRRFELWGPETSTSLRWCSSATEEDCLLHVLNLAPPLHNLMMCWLLNIAEIWCSWSKFSNNNFNHKIYNMSHKIYNMSHTRTRHNTHTGKLQFQENYNFI